MAKKSKQVLMLEYAKKFFQKKKVLIVETSKVNVTSLKKLFTDLGVSTQKIHVENSIPSAISYMEETRPEVIIANQLIDSREGLDLLDHHLISYPNRSQVCFFIISDDNSPSIGTIALDTETDGVLVTPFTIKSLESSVLKSIQTKIKPSPYFSNLEKTKEHIRNNDLQTALETAEESLILTKAPFMAKALKGQIYRLSKDYEKSKIELKDVLKEVPDHYPSLREIYLLYGDMKDFENQYEIASLILNYYPLNPSHVPELTRLSIRNQKYEDIINYSNIFTEVKFVQESVKTYLAAGLAICGKFLTTINKIEEAQKALQKAAQASQGKGEILYSVIKTYLDLKCPDDALQVLATFSSNKTSKEISEICDFEINSYTLKADEVLSLGLELINNGNKDKRIFTRALDIIKTDSIKNQKSDEMTKRAKELYPELFK